jgi:hypothetical protein
MTTYLNDLKKNQGHHQMLTRMGRNCISLIHRSTVDNLAFSIKTKLATTIQAKTAHLGVSPET